MPDRFPNDGRRGFDRFALFGIVAVALTRILFRSRMLYDLDSVNFALGMLRFDPAAHQPHPPGYFLYVSLAALVQRFFENPNDALVAISIAASCGTAWMIYLLSREWFGRDTARIAMLLFLFSPLCWFHGIVALTYIVEAFFSAWIGYWCWRVYQGKGTDSPFRLSIAFGVAAGFRPSTACSWPLCGCSRSGAAAGGAGRQSRRQAATILLWFVPMADAAGGYASTWQLFNISGPTVPGRRTTSVLSLAGGCQDRDHRLDCSALPGIRRVSLRIRSRQSRSRPGIRAEQVHLAMGRARACVSSPLFSSTTLIAGICWYCVRRYSPWLAARVHGFLKSTGHRTSASYDGGRGDARQLRFLLLAPVYCSYRSVRGVERDIWRL